VTASIGDSLSNLRNAIAGLDAVLVAFSGGVDSTLVLRVALDVLGPQRVLAVTAASAMHKPEDTAEAVRLARELGADHEVVTWSAMQVPEVVENGPERCYYCKHAVFSRLARTAEERGFRHVADGTTADDPGVYRPGLRASKELGIRQPLREAGLKKPEIRELSRHLGLPTADKPASPCLATRLPYGMCLTEERLKRVGDAERALSELGLAPLRVRLADDNTARIEVSLARLADLASDPLREQVVAAIRAAGLHYVTVDLRGLRSGSMDEVLPA